MVLGLKLEQEVRSTHTCSQETLVQSDQQHADHLGRDDSLPTFMSVFYFSLINHLSNENANLKR